MKKNDLGMEMIMNRQKTGEFLKYLRKEKGVTQEQLAEQFSVSSRTVSRWETGSNMPDLDTLVELADFYEVDIRELIEGERKSETMDKEQKEIFTKIADYSKCKEKVLLRKLIAIVVIGIVAWAASFTFLIHFMNSAQGAGFILICETITLLLYGMGMLCVKTNRSVQGFLNSVIGAVSGVVLSNVALLIIFFGSGSYYNYGIIGAYYSLLTLLATFLLAGIVTSIINIWADKSKH